MSTPVREGRKACRDSRVHIVPYGCISVCTCLSSHCVGGCISVCKFEYAQCPEAVSMFVQV